MRRTGSPNHCGRAAATTKKANAVSIVEYYDLPYKYGHTLIKLLAQTPKTLFVYSSDDKVNGKLAITDYKVLKEEIENKKELLLAAAKDIDI